MNKVNKGQRHKWFWFHRVGGAAIKDRGKNCAVEPFLDPFILLLLCEKSEKV